MLNKKLSTGIISLGLSALLLAGCGSNSSDNKSDLVATIQKEDSKGKKIDIMDELSNKELKHVYGGIFEASQKLGIYDFNQKRLEFFKLLKDSNSKNASKGKFIIEGNNITAQFTPNGLSNIWGQDLKNHKLNGLGIVGSSYNDHISVKGCAEFTDNKANIFNGYYQLYASSEQALKVEILSTKEGDNTRVKILQGHDYDNYSDAIVYYNMVVKSTDPEVMVYDSYRDKKIPVKASEAEKIDSYSKGKRIYDKLLDINNLVSLDVIYYKDTQFNTFSLKDGNLHVIKQHIEDNGKRIMEYEAIIPISFFEHDPRHNLSPLNRLTIEDLSSVPPVGDVKLYKLGKLYYKGHINENGKYDGQGTLYREDGSVEYEGKFSNGEYAN